MLKSVALAMAFGLSSAALAQQGQPVPDAQSASPTPPQPGAGESGARCDFMSREEMLMCQATKPGDASGVRSSLCDTVSANTIEGCLRQQEPVASDKADEFRNRRSAKTPAG